MAEIKRLFEHFYHELELNDPEGYMMLMAQKALEYGFDLYPQEQPKPEDLANRPVIDNVRKTSWI